MGHNSEDLVPEQDSQPAQQALRSDPRDALRASVRFTEKEFLKIKRASIESGRSVPWLLKTAFFEHGITPPTLDEETRKVVRREIAYMGNNLNQLAKNVNSGLISGVHAEVQEMLQHFRVLRSYLNLNYGDPR